MKKHKNPLLIFLAPIAILMFIGGVLMLNQNADILLSYKNYSKGKLYVIGTYIVSGDGSTKAGDTEVLAGFVVDSIHKKLTPFKELKETSENGVQMFKYKSYEDTVVISYDIEKSTWNKNIGTQSSSWADGIRYYKPKYANLKQGDTLYVWYDNSFHDKWIDFVAEYPNKQSLYIKSIRNTIKDFLTFFIPVCLIFIFRFASQTLRENKIRKLCLLAYIGYLIYYFGLLN